MSVTNTMIQFFILTERELEIRELHRTQQESVEFNLQLTKQLKDLQVSFYMSIGSYPQMVYISKEKSVLFLDSSDIL